MNERLLDNPVSELAVLSDGATTDTSVPAVVLVADTKEPLISIPGVGEIIGTLGENYPAFYWFMVEHVEGCNV